MATSRPSIYVVGAGAGVGCEVASLFAKNGFDVGLIARSASTLANSNSRILTTLPTGKIVPVIHTATADATDPDTVINALESLHSLFGRGPTVMVYNIGSLGKHNSELGPTPLESLTLDAMQKHFTISVGSAFVVAQWAAKNLDTTTSHKSMLFFTGGGLGISPFPKLAGLGMAKAALRNLSLSYHADLKPKGIHAASVMILAPLTAEDKKYNPTLVAGEFLKLYHQSPVEEWSTETLY